MEQGKPYKKMMTPVESNQSVLERVEGKTYADLLKEITSTGSKRGSNCEKDQEKEELQIRVKAGPKTELLMTGRTSKKHAETRSSWIPCFILRIWKGILLKTVCKKILEKQLLRERTK